MGDSARASVIERLPPDLARLLNRLALELKKMYGERYRGLVLYGSYARGEADEGSDVDLLLLLEGPVNSTRELLRAEEAEWPLALEAGYTVSLLPVTLRLTEAPNNPFSVTHEEKASRSLERGRGTTRQSRTLVRGCRAAVGSRRHGLRCFAGLLYGYFYVAEALLLSEGLSFSRHAQVISQYRLHFAKSEVLDPRVSILGSTGLSVAPSPCDSWPTTLPIQALRLAEELLADVVLMDLKMPGMGGIEATRAIVGRNPHAGVIMVTMFEDDESVFAALKAGARGYVLKDADRGMLLRAIRAVARGEALLGAPVARRVLEQFSGPPPMPAPAHPERPSPLFDELTPRELEVLRLIAQGLKNREIAEKLVISEKTVGNHISNIFVKLQVNDRSQAIVCALRGGLVNDERDR